MTARRNICVVTGTRAEFGLLSELILQIEADPELNLQLLVTGSHLSPAFGLTVEEIEKEGIPIAVKVPMLVEGDNETAMALSVGTGILGYTEAYTTLKPDIVLVLGDRFEILAAAETAMLLNIPMAHLHGGEVTEGAVDESIRHAITKMATWHFVAAEAYRQRVIQLGEHPDRVFNFGAPGLDKLRTMKFLSREQLSESLHFPIRDTLLLVTYHPVTRSQHSSSGRLDVEQSVGALLTALEQFVDCSILITKANTDAGGLKINRIMEEWSAPRAHVCSVSSLGHLRYLSAMKLAAAVIGNSSSGLTEAPSLKVPTVNIGDRQKGRLRAASVLDCSEQTEAIRTAVTTALSPQFRAIASQCTSPYGSGNASVRIKETLKSVNLTGATRKSFYDLPGRRQS